MFAYAPRESWAAMWAGPELIVRFLMAVARIASAVAAQGTAWPAWPVEIVSDGAAGRSWLLAPLSGAMLATPFGRALSCVVSMG